MIFRNDIVKVVWVISKIFNVTFFMDGTRRGAMIYSGYQLEPTFFDFKK